MPVTILSIRHTGQSLARSKMAQLVKAIIAKTDAPSSIPGTHIMEKEN